MITGWDIKMASRGTGPTERLSVERPGLYALPGLLLDGAQSKDVTLHFVPFADAKEYRVWIPRARAGAAK